MSNNTEDTKAQVERLRELAGYKYQYHTMHVPANLHHAAATIERLARDHDALAAECARLMEALRMIEDCVTDDPGAAYVIAKTALAAPKGAD